MLTEKEKAICKQAASELTDLEKAICRQMGVSQEDYSSTKQADLETALCREREMYDQKLLEEAKASIMKLVGISPAEAAKRLSEAEAAAAARAPMTREELEACRLLGVEPLLEYYPAKLVAAGLEPKLPS